MAPGATAKNGQRRSGPMDAFLDTRLQWHHLAQLLDAFGRENADAHPDWHHIAIRVDEDTWTSAEAHGVRLQLRRDGSLAILADHDHSFGLDGATFAQVHATVRAALEHHGVDSPLEVREDLPDHPIEGGAKIHFDPDSTTRLFDMFARCKRLLDAEGKKAPALLWPHHFDLSRMDTLRSADDDGEGLVTMTRGLSPGDDSYDRPYWYVTPWPWPPADVELPDLPSGFWHRDHWTGAVLFDRDAGTDEEVRAFWDGGAEVCRVVLPAE